MSRLRAAIVKESWALFRDPKARISLLLPPLIQLLIFSFAATLEVKNADIGVYDMSGGVHSAEIVNRIAASENFDEIVPLRSPGELRDAVDRQQIIAALVFEADFDADVESGKPAKIGAVFDGRRSNAAQIVNGYLGAIVGTVGADLNPARAPPAQGSIVRHWFNPNLSFLWFNIPALACLIVSISALSVTAQSVARERELGTFDQLMVSPLRTHEILIGKMVPPFLLSMFNGLLFVVAAPIYGVPFTGSLPLFLLGLAFYALALIGFGMFVSSLSKTQQQAFLGAFVITVPMVLLSGFAAPIDNMPGWLQPVTYLIPVRYFLEISIGTFLKAMPVLQVLSLVWPLALLSAFTLTASAWLFRARME